MLNVASLLSAPVALVDLSAVATPSITSVVALIVLGLLVTGFATPLYFRLVQGPGPTFLSFVNHLVSAWAVLAGAMFLDESLPLSVILGLALILASIGLSELGSRAIDRLKAMRLRCLPASPPSSVREDA